MKNKTQHTPVGAAPLQARSTLLGKNRPFHETPVAFSDEELVLHAILGSCGPRHLELVTALEHSAALRHQLQMIRIDLSLGLRPELDVLLDQLGEKDLAAWDPDKSTASNNPRTLAETPLWAHVSDHVAVTLKIAQTVASPPERRALDDVRVLVPIKPPRSKHRRLR